MTLYAHIRPPKTHVEMQWQIGMILAATQKCKELRDRVAAELTQFDRGYAMQIDVVDQAS